MFFIIIIIIIIIIILQLKMSQSKLKQNESIHLLTFWQMFKMIVWDIKRDEMNQHTDPVG